MHDFSEGQAHAKRASGEMAWACPEPACDIIPGMKAQLLTAPGRLELADLEVPPVGPAEVRVRVAACGICGSDVHGYTGAPAGGSRRW